MCLRWYIPAQEGGSSFRHLGLAMLLLETAAVGPLIVIFWVKQAWAAESIFLPSWASNAWDTQGSPELD